MLKDLLTLNRSYRRFYEEQSIHKETLIQLIELARLSPSPRNLQPYKFAISVLQEANKKIFETLAWAGYLTDWPGPDVGERPSAYIIILNDKTISKNLDRDNICYGAGIVGQSIMIGAVEKGIGGCMISSVQRSRLAEKIGLKEELEILIVLALGLPKEEIVLDELDSEGDVKYWRDENKIHHVPKRTLKELILDVRIINEEE